MSSTLVDAPDLADPKAGLVLDMLQAPPISRRKVQYRSVDVGHSRLVWTLDIEVATASKVPILFLPKLPGSLFAFDFVDTVTGSALQVPPRRVNAQWANRVLLAQALRLLSSKDLRQHGHEIVRTLQFICQASGTIAEAEIRRTWVDPGSAASQKLSLHERTDRVRTGWRGRLACDPVFWWLLVECAASGLIVIELEKGQHILKFGYEIYIPPHPQPILQRALRTMGLRSLEWPLNVAWAGAGSFHLEVYMPRGLRLVGTKLLDRSDKSLPRRTPLSPRVEHIYIADARDKRGLIAKYWARPSANSTGRTALGASVLSFALILFLARQAEWIRAHGSSSELNGVLVAIPGLLTAYLARPSHPVAAALARPSRLLLLWSALVSFCAAIGATFVTSQQSVNEIAQRFLLLALLSGLSVLGLAVLRLSLWTSRLKSI